jgi:hypothetical protein
MPSHAAQVLLASALVLTLGGCAASLPEVTEGPSAVGDTKAIVVLSPTFAKLVDTPTSGQVVFVSDEGVLTSVATDGIDGGLVTEHDDSVYFTDQHNDYIFDGTLTTVPRQTREYSQELLVATDEGYVSVFNSNYSEDGSYYQYDISSGGGGEPVEKRYQHYFELLGDCDGVVYGVSVPEGYPDVDTAPRSLLQLYPSGASDEPRATWTPDAATLQEGLGIPCVNRELYFVSTEARGDPESEQGRDFAGFLLRAWNVDTGILRSVPLRGATGHPLAERNWEYPFLTRSSWHIDDGTFYWIDGNGILLATNLETGITSVIAALHLQNLQSASNRVEFDGDVVHVLDLFPSSGSEGAITTYRLSDGEQLESFTVTGLARLAQATNLIVTDFEVLG